MASHCSLSVVEGFHALWRRRLAGVLTLSTLEPVNSPLREGSEVGAAAGTLKVEDGLLRCTLGATGLAPRPLD